jgi:hypothetical protein
VAKVFVSHRGVDVDTAQAGRLARELEAAGHEVWLDVWEIDPGDSIVGKVDSGLASADVVVLCLSGDVDGVHTAWMLREWGSALARQLDGPGVKLMPAVLTGGRLPAILADVKAADLVADWPAGVAALLRAINRHAGTP